VSGIKENTEGPPLDLEYRGVKIATKEDDKKADSGPLRERGI